MAHTYKAKGPELLGESFKFNPDTKIMTLGNVTYTFPGDEAVLMAGPLTPAELSVVAMDQTGSTSTLTAAGTAEFIAEGDPGHTGTVASPTSLTFVNGICTAATGV